MKKKPPRMVSSLPPPLNNTEETGEPSQEEEKCAEENFEAPAVEEAQAVETPASLTDAEAEALMPSEEINDPGAVFRLAYLDERKKSMTFLKELKKRVYEEQIHALKMERGAVLAQIDRELANIEEMSIQARHDVEQKHALNLAQYAYDDELGILRKVIEDTKPGAEVSTEN